MINIEFLKKQIEAMDVKSEEFFELYTTIADKYYTFPEPDDLQQAVMMLRMYIDKASGSDYEEQVIVITKLVTELFAMEQKKSGACMGTLGFKDKEYHFTLASDPKHIETMKDMMGKVLKGDFTIKGK